MAITLGRLTPWTLEVPVLILGLILLVIGYLVGISPLVTIGWILIVIGLVLLLLPLAGGPLVGGRRWF